MGSEPGDVRAAVNDDDAGGKKLLSKSRLTAVALALGGMIVGSLVGIAVQVGVETTGLLGPSVEALIAEQESNFDDMTAKLEALRTMETGPEMARGIDELGRLLSRQAELQQQSSQELALLGKQVASLRQQSLEEKGFAGGADVWLDAGESVSVGDTDHVFGVVRTWANEVDVKLNGRKSRLTVGDSVNVEAANTDCTVFVKQARRSEDGRFGFDVSCS
jgi:hypothetical protein